MALPNPLISQLDETQAEFLASEGRDYCITNGIILHDIATNSPVPVPFTLCPAPLPKRLHEQAVELQKDFNLLVDRVSRNHEFLKQSLLHTVVGDPFVGRLFKIYTKALEQGVYSKTISVGVLRSDYFCEVTHANGPPVEKRFGLKQVELNIICGGATQTQSVIEMFKREEAREVQNLSVVCKQNGPRGVKRLFLHLHGKEVDRVVPNTAQETTADALIHAWNLYGSPSAVLMFVVLPKKIEASLYDHRLLEYTIRKRCPGLNVIRRTLKEIHDRGTLKDDNTLYVDEQEIAIAYYRTGYNPEHYQAEECFLAREMVELSRAAKCPSIAYQLVGLKKIQQVLAETGVLEKFFDDGKTVARIRSTFAGLYSLDQGPEGDRNAAMAIENPDKFVLKPQRDGGFDNFFGDEIREQLQKMSVEERSKYTLMDRIVPVVTPNYFVTHREKQIKKKETHSEFGYFGTIVSKGTEVVLNEQGGYHVRCKNKNDPTGGLLAGDSCVSAGIYLI